MERTIHVQPRILGQILRDTKLVDLCHVSDDVDLKNQDSLISKYVIKQLMTSQVLNTTASTR